MHAFVILAGIFALLKCCEGATDLIEVKALQSFYETNYGADWKWLSERTNGAVWNFSKPIAAINPCGDGWQGLVCSSTEATCLQSWESCHVIEISLNFYDIRGPFPSAIAAMTQLEVFSLYSNLLSSSVPSSFFNFTNLKTFDVEANELTGIIPDTICNITTLEVLYLGYNHFYGTISSDIGLLTKLSILHFQYNSFSRSLPTTLGLATALRSLFLPGNEMSGSVPADLANCTDLMRLVTVGNSFAGSLYDGLFASLTKLTRIDMSDNYLTGHFPSSMSNLSSIVEFIFTSNAFSGSLPAGIEKLTTLTQLRLDANFLSGTLPSALAVLTRLERIIINTNLFSGELSAEFGKLTRLKYLTVNENYLAGTLPQSLGNLPNLELMWSAQNLFSGSIPNSFGRLVELVSLVMHNSYHTGTIPSSLGNCKQVHQFSLFGMGLTGTIPAELGNMTLVAWLILNGNDLTGQIPHSIGLLPELLELSLSNNRLSHSIPKSIGRLPKLEILALDGNRLTGHLPEMHVLSLKAFFVQGNRLRGSVRDTFWDPHDVALTHVDVSDNLFSGQVPTEIFHMPNITTIAMSGNCFSGSLPPDLCLARQIEVLSLNGLGSGRGCSDAVKSLFSSRVVLYNTLDGSLPNCVWYLPYLRILHATGNGLTGRIPELSRFSALQDISLAHNQISGTIPTSIQQRQQLTNLDLSFNNIRGGFNDGVVNITSQVSLEVNRLSGKLHPSNLRSSSLLRVLRGNVFACGSLPANDEDADLYSCGSEDLDTALFTWIAMGGVVGVCALLSLAVRRFTHFPTPDGSSFSFDFIERGVYRRIAILCNNLSFYLTYLQTLEGSSRSLQSMFRFDKELYAASRYLTCLAGICIATTFPVIVLKLIHRDDDVGYTTTHSHVYTWLVSLAYSTGELTAAMVVAAWFVVVVAYSAILLRLQQRTQLEDMVPRDSVVAESYRPGAAVDTAVASQGQGHTLRILSLLVLNFIIVGSVNFLFVRQVSNNKVDATMLQVLQVSLALFKMAYSVFCVPMLCKSIKDYKKSIWVRTRIHLLNGVIIPILISMRTSPMCMSGLFEPGDAVGSVYTYNDCVGTLYSPTTGLTSCSIYRHVEVEVAALVPPFLYRHQCSSVLLTSYIPVYIYSYMFQLALPFGVLMMCFIPYTSIPRMLRMKFPGVFWPGYWATNSDERLTFEESEAVNAESVGVATGRKLINIKTIVSQMLSHITVLLTFGLCSPILAAVVIVSMAVTSNLLRVIISRFVHYRVSCMLREGNRINHVLLGKNGAGGGSFAREGNQGSTSGSSEKDVAAVLEQSDFAITVLSDELKDIPEMLLVCYSAILITSTFFFMMLCLDLAGDEVGWEKAEWVPIVFACLLVLILAVQRYCVLKIRESVKKDSAVQDSKLYEVQSNPLAREVEMGGGMGSGLSDVRAHP